MSLRDSLRTEKAKERYDRNYNSIETTFTQKELDEHDKEIRNKAIDEFAEKMKELIYKWIDKGVIAIGCIDEIAEQMKGV